MCARPVLYSGARGLTPWYISIAKLKYCWSRVGVIGLVGVALMFGFSGYAQGSNQGIPKVAAYAEAELWRVSLEVDQAEDSAQMCAIKAITLAQMASMALAAGQPSPQLWQAAVQYAELAWYLEPQNPNYTRLLAELYTVSELWHPALLLWTAYASEVVLDPLARHLASVAAAQVGHQHYRLGLKAQAVSYFKASLELEPSLQVETLLAGLEVNTNHM